MPIFFLHLCNGEGFVEDEEGSDHDHLRAARSTAVRGLRDALAGDLRQGYINTAAFIEIEDENRSFVETVHFADAVKIVTHNGRKSR